MFRDDIKAEGTQKKNFRLKLDFNLSFLNRIKGNMQPTYLYPSEFDKEIEWRSKFSIMIPVVIGFAQMILTFAIVGLEIASLIISPSRGTLYAGFWLSLFFTFSWVSMFTLGNIMEIKV